MSSGRRGFTLVEMAVAIAILAFVLVSLTGLLSVGLSTQKSSLDDTRAAAVAQYVIAMEHMNSFANVSVSSYTTNYYFDLSGNTNTAAASYYQAKVSNISSFSGNSGLLGANVAPMQLMLTYPLPACTKTNVFYYNRSNE